MFAPSGKGLLFLSSYIPLWIVILIVNGRSLGLFATLPAMALVLGVLGLALLVHQARTAAPVPMIVKTLQRTDFEAVAYIVTYLFPFVGGAIATPDAGAGLAILFVVVMVAYVRADMIHVNPILLAAGLHSYRVGSNNGLESVLISPRKQFKQGSELAVIRLAEGVWWERIDAKPAGGTGAQPPA